MNSPKGFIPKTGRQGFKYTLSCGCVKRGITSTRSSDNQLYAPLSVGDTAWCWVCGGSKMIVAREPLAELPSD